MSFNICWKTKTQASIIRGTILASFLETSSTNLKATNLHREFAKHLQITATPSRGVGVRAAWRIGITKCIQTMFNSFKLIWNLFIFVIVYSYTWMGSEALARSAEGLERSARTPLPGNVGVKFRESPLTSTHHERNQLENPPSLDLAPSGSLTLV